VGEIARRLGPDIKANRERVRHWTREGLVSPVAHHHAGTGHRRRYEESVVYDAAILSTLARAGLHIVSRSYLPEVLSKARQARQHWQSATERGPLFLEISHAADGRAVIAVDTDRAKCDPAAELAILINLSEIYQTCEKKNT
jgi:hypothetical protein